MKQCKLLLLCISLFFSHTSLAASAAEIDIKSNAAIKLFTKEIAGGRNFLQNAAGVLVFPQVLKAGFGIGGEYGEGALKVGNKTVAYYNTIAASIGLQLGAQTKTVILVFMNNQALQNFQKSEGWEIGVDGSVALIEIGGGKDINSINIDDPIVGFVFSNKGLMFNLTLEGSKINRIHPK